MSELKLGLISYIMRFKLCLSKDYKKILVNYWMYKFFCLISAKTENKNSV